MASIAKITGVPPRNLLDCIGLVCNGEIEISPNLQERLKKCSTIIGVDGGLNHCKKMQIFPHWVVGDFDSANATILEEAKNEQKSIVLPRAKDVTDLEVALDKAKSISTLAQVIIWGGLGGRIDHTLGNIFLLFRNPARLFLESEQQVLFALKDNLGEVEISHTTHKTLALIPLNGPATNISLKEEDKILHIPIIDKTKPFMIPFKEKCILQVGSGEVLVILETRNLLPLPALPEADIPLQFTLSQPLIHIFNYLTHQSLHFRAVKLYSNKESVFNIQPASGEVIFGSKRGQTISLIPFYGSANGIKTKELKWELGETTVSKLDKDFVGISNVSMGDRYTVAIESGELLCIVNETLIDEELVDAKIEKKAS